MTISLAIASGVLLYGFWCLCWRIADDVAELAEERAREDALAGQAEGMLDVLREIKR